MESLFNTNTYTNTVSRINNLTESSPALWGKMKVSQMLAHCKEAFKVPLSDKEIPRMFIGRLIGWAIKPKLYNEDPWKKNLPTSPDFVIKDERNFDIEKEQLLSLVNKFYTGGPENSGNFPHPMFGKFSKEQWGQAMYKHLDHHLRQFGV